MNTHAKNNKIFYLIIVVALIMLAGLIANIGNVALVMLEILQNDSGHLFVKLVGMSTGFILIPTFISKKIGIEFEEELVPFSKNQSILILVIILLMNSIFIKSDEIFTALIVAICEEYLFRYVAFHILFKEYHTFFTIIVTSLLFGLLLHINGDFWLNATIKVPAGYLLSRVGLKFGLQYSIAIHWLHNVVVGKTI
ncbi:TPA: CPBP family intramembrane glutamic endopeptidase [Streptococcus suis]